MFQMRLLFLLLAFGFFIPSYGQVVFHPDQSDLIWPFPNSYTKNQGAGTGGWNNICGSGCGLHQDGDYRAQDWSVTECGPIASQCGQLILAPFAGRVVMSAAANISYGNQLVLQSLQDSTYALRLAHLQDFLVGRGDTVVAKQPIALMGDTGNGGCHVHFALYKNLYDTLYTSPDTYLQWILDNPLRRPPNPTQSVDFTFEAVPERLEFEAEFPDSESLYFLEDSIGFSGRLTNTSPLAAYSLEFRVLDAWVPEQGKEWQEVLQSENVYLAPEQAQSLSLSGPAAEPGEHILQYQASGANCTYETLGATTITVRSREACANQHEPNASAATAAPLPTLAGQTLIQALHSYLYTELGPEADYFQWQIDQPGYFSASLRGNAPENGYFLYNGARLPLQYFAEPQLLYPGESLLWVVESTDQTSACTPYTLVWEWSPRPEFLLSPNPSLGSATTLTVPQALADYSVQLYNAQGKAVYTARLTADATATLHLTPSLSSGWYYLHVSAPNTTSTRLTWLIQ